jgi:hypothetical protein
VGEGVPPGFWSAAGTCDRVVRFPSEGSSAEFARTVGDNEVVGPTSVFGLGGVECHGRRGSVRRLSLLRKSRKEDFPTSEERIAVLKSAA